MGQHTRLIGRTKVAKNPAANVNAFANVQRQRAFALEDIHPRCAWQRLQALGINLVVRHGQTESAQFVNIVGHHAPHQKVILLFNQPGRINRVFCHQLDHAPTAVQALDGELIV